MFLLRMGGFQTTSVAGKGYYLRSCSIVLVLALYRHSSRVTRTIVLFGSAICLLRCSVTCSISSSKVGLCYSVLASHVCRQLLGLINIEHIS